MSRAIPTCSCGLTIRKIARDDGDPLAERRRRKVPSFEDAAKEVHGAHGASFKNEKHRKQWLSSLGEVFKDDKKH